MAEIIIHNKFKAKMDLRGHSMVGVTFDEPNEEFIRFYTYWCEFEYRKQFPSSVIGILDDGTKLEFFGCFPGTLTDLVRNDPDMRYFRIIFDHYKIIYNGEV